MYSCGYNFRLPLRGVGPTGRRLDLEKTISFSDSLLVLQNQYSMSKVLDKSRVAPIPMTCQNRPDFPILAYWKADMLSVHMKNEMHETLKERFDG